MAKPIGLQMLGAAELERLLRRTPKRIQGRVVRNATRAGAVIFRRKAKAKAPKRSGQLRRGIIMRSRRGRDRDEFRVVVGLRSGKRSAGGAFYGLFEEYGTKHHRARPFMRPAFDEGKDQAATAVIDRLWERIEVELRK